MEGRQEDGWGQISGNTSHKLQPHGRHTCSFLKSLGFLSGRSLPTFETLPALILWSLLPSTMVEKPLVLNLWINWFIVRIADFSNWFSIHGYLSTFIMMLLGKINIGREVFYHWRSGQPWGDVHNKENKKIRKDIYHQGQLLCLRISVCFSESP